MNAAILDIRKYHQLGEIYPEEDCTVIKAMQIMSTTMPNQFYIYSEVSFIIVNTDCSQISVHKTGALVPLLC